MAAADSGLEKHAPPSTASAAKARPASTPLRTVRFQKRGKEEALIDGRQSCCNGRAGASQAHNPRRTTAYRVFTRGAPLLPAPMGRRSGQRHAARDRPGVAVSDRRRLWVGQSSRCSVEGDSERCCAPISMSSVQLVLAVLAIDAGSFDGRRNERAHASITVPCGCALRAVTRDRPRACTASVDRPCVCTNARTLSVVLDPSTNNADGDPWATNLRRPKTSRRSKTRSAKIARRPTRAPRRARTRGPRLRRNRSRRDITRDRSSQGRRAPLLRREPR